MIRYFEEHDVLENVRARGAELAARLREITARYPIAGELRGRGLLYCLDFVDPVTGGPLTAASPWAPPSSGRHGDAACSPRSPHNATLAPPLILTSAEVAEIADIFEESVAEVSEQVVSGGGVEIEVAFGL